MSPLRAAALGLGTAAALAACACGGENASPEGPPAPDRATFVEVFVDLRLRALESPEGLLSPADREAVLEGHGVTREELGAFVEIHGEDPGYMMGVWQEVRNRLEAEANLGDQEEAGPPAPSTGDPEEAPGRGADAGR